MRPSPGGSLRVVGASSPGPPSVVPLGPGALPAGAVVHSFLGAKLPTTILWALHREPPAHLPDVSAGGSVFVGGAFRPEFLNSQIYLARARPPVGPAPRLGLGA